MQIIALINQKGGVAELVRQLAQLT